MMLKFDPDDAEEDDDGSPTKQAMVSGGAEPIAGMPGGAAMPAPGAVPYHHEGVVPPITLTINTSHSDGSPDKIRINNVQPMVRPIFLLEA